MYPLGALTSPAELELADKPGRAIESPEEATTRRRLVAISALGTFATVTGVSLFAYPITFEALRTALVYMHDAIGDVLLAGGVLYLVAHLRQTWKMKRLKVSRWTGYVAIACWLAAGATGIYGQLEPMPSHSTISWVHALSSLALIVLACFHGAWGFLRKKRPRER